MITCLWIMLRLVAGCRRGERNWGSHRRTRRNGPASLWSTCPKLKTTLDLLDRLCCVLEYDLARAFTGVQTTSPDYGQEQVLRLFNACAPRVKPVVLHLLEQLATLT